MAGRSTPLTPHVLAHYAKTPLEPLCDFLWTREDGQDLCRDLVDLCDNPAAVGRVLATALNLEPGLRDLLEERELVEPLLFPTLDGAHLLDLELPEPRWAVDRLIPEEGLTLLVGSPKIGKSWLALELCRAVAEGESVLGERQTQSGQTLYLALEDSTRRLQQRMRQLQANHDRRIGAGLQLATELPSGRGDGFLETLDRWLTGHPETSMVVVDTLQRVRATAKGQGNAYENDSDAMSRFQELAIEHGVALVLVHHTRKAEASDPFEKISGSTGLMGVADTTLLIKRGRGESDAELWVTGRDLDEQHLALSFERGLWTIAGNAERLALSAAQREILVLLEKVGQPLRPTNIARRLGKSRPAVQQLLGKLQKSGWLENDHGSYSLYTPDPAEDDLIPVEADDAVFDVDHDAMAWARR